jgi:hypothetical protein
MRRIFAALAALTVSASPVLAQSASPAFVRGSGGVTFMSEPGALFSGTVGVRLTPSLHVIGDVGRLTNILPRTIQHDLDVAARMMGPAYGASLTIDGRAPGLYALGGIRVSRAMRQRAVLFIEAGGGLARGTSRITARASGRDVSREVTAALHIKHSERRGAAAIGGGVAMPLTRRLGLDLGYRYLRIFTDDPRINTGAMTAGLRLGF